ncbi:alpha/beta hydrolase [Mesorhizobium sp. BAC0120]|uniref:alpha/beta hydrolase n=1 Tax=Mesorhizobium sp. BAC0120 TaxID=3090670 RepID=UPI00298CE94B|nr:alpha/beta hydrolase [Mesorhizobium sp. BAC0120]MDW6021549.1 alpha/beta hydrolase [Mesorhizobium sp. BAC0120]
MPQIGPLLKALAILLVLPLVSCTALTVYNDLVPQNRAEEVVTSDIAYGSEHRQKLDIYKPAGGAANKDVVVFFYGGSWKLGRKEEVSFVANALTQRGYVVVVPDYRLVPEVTYPAFVEDSAKAIAWTYRNIANYGGNRQRIFVAGHSAGAYNAMMVALGPEFLGNEGLSPSIMHGVIGISGPYDFLPFKYMAEHRAFDSAAPDLASTQPIKRVAASRGTPPVLLLAGASETLVPPKNPRELAAELHKAGKPVKVILYPGARHIDTLLAFSKTHRKKAAVLDDMVAWMTSH